MFNRWGPIKLFTFRDYAHREMNRTFHALVDLCESNNTHGWNEFKHSMQRIEAVVRWVADNAEAIARVFPKNRQRQFSRKSDLVVMQYAEGVWPLRLDVNSRNKGANCRIVVNADSKNNLECRIGEFNNYTGKILHYRDRYPEPEHCELCNTEPVTGVCHLCGRCYCSTCSTKCAKCGHTFCSRCASQMYPLPSLHDWHFHRASSQTSRSY